MPAFENIALRYYALASTVIALHLVVLALWTGTVRVKSKRWVNPEDAKFSKGENADRDHPDVERAKRAHYNALENAIPFFVVAALFALSGATPEAAQIYFGVFVGARILHSVFYLWGRQPFRTLSFAVGTLAIVGMGVHVIRTAM